jgi:hypothetical protein
MNSSIVRNVLVNQPGVVRGWGFSITNDSGYLEVTNAEFCVNPVSMPVCTASSIGSFTNFISQFNNIIVGPVGGTLPSLVSQAFDPFLLTGVGGFEFLPGIGPYIESGQVVLTYNLYDSDPNEGSANSLSTGIMLTANASVSSQVPEPRYAFAVCVVMTLMVFLKRGL